jgi:putative transposase
MPLRLDRGRNTPNLETVPKEALARFGGREIVNPDQGSQFTSPCFTDVLPEAGIRVSMIGLERWIGDVPIEPLWRSLKYGCFCFRAFEAHWELRFGLTWWIGVTIPGVYTRCRPEHA